MKRLFALMLASLFLSAGAEAAAWLQTGQVTAKPFGHAVYCARHRSDCRAHGGAPALADVAAETLALLNRQVNQAIEEKDDRERYGQADVWEVAGPSGDCEDFALAKRERLIDRGLHPGNLLLAVGRRFGAFHAVLVVRTPRGDFVLDNTTDRVHRVDRARMRFLKLQSSVDAGQWIEVTGFMRTSSTGG